MALTEAAAPKILPTGEQYTITAATQFGDAVVTITQVAASLRAFTVDGVDIVQRYPADAPPSLGAGIVMVPWPNRVRDGLWNLDEAPQQLDITEPKFQNALHGLLVHTAYDVAEHTSEAITLTAMIYTGPGYPFILRTWVTYALGQEGLVVTHTIRNEGVGNAPVALGTHAYFTIGGVNTADLILTNSARSVYENDHRLLPIRIIPVSDQLDLRDGRPVGDLVLDDCYADQDIVDGEHRTRLTAPDGRWVELWTDLQFGHIVLLTTSNFVGPDGNEILAVAIEPQTAPADAFNSGVGVSWLAPEESWSVEWGVRADMALNGAHS